MRTLVDSADVLDKMSLTEDEVFAQAVEMAEAMTSSSTLKNQDGPVRLSKSDKQQRRLATRGPPRTYTNKYAYNCLPSSSGRITAAPRTTDDL